MYLKYQPNDSDNGASRVTVKSKQTTSDTSWGRIVLYCLKQITGIKFTLSFWVIISQIKTNQSYLARKIMFFLHPVLPSCYYLVHNLFVFTTHEIVQNRLQTPNKLFHINAQPIPFVPASFGDETALRAEVRLF